MSNKYLCLEHQMTNKYPMFRVSVSITKFYLFYVITTSLFDEL